MLQHDPLGKEASPTLLKDGQIQATKKHLGAPVEESQAGTAILPPYIHCHPAKLQLESAS